MTVEGGAGPPVREEYFESFQEIVNSASNWSYSRANWLLPAVTPPPFGSIDSGSEADSRKNSYFSSHTSDTVLYDEKPGGPAQRASETFLDTTPLWRSFLHTSGRPTPAFETWEDGLAAVEQACCSIPSSSAFDVTLAVHGVFIGAGIPIGFIPSCDNVRHLHQAVRDLCIMLHACNAYGLGFADIPQRILHTTHRLVEEVRLWFPYPRGLQEFAGRTNSGAVVSVSELGIVLKELPVESDSHIVERIYCTEVARLSELLEEATTPAQQCCVLDLVSVVQMYSAHNTWGTTAMGITLVDFLACRVAAHMALHDNTESPQNIREVLNGVLRFSGHCESRPNITFLRSGGVRGGTKRALVEQITLPEQSADIVHPFLMTFSAFMNEYELLELLEERYATSAFEEYQSAEMRAYQENESGPIRARVVATILTWMNTYWLDLPEEQLSTRTPVIERLLAFSERTGNPHFIAKAKEVAAKHSCNRADSPEQLTPTLPAAGTPMPSLANLSAREVAVAMTSIKFEKYIFVTPQSLLWRQVGRTTDPDTPLVSYIRYWNEEANWVSHEILQVADQRRRAEMIGFFIDVCEELRCLNNFSSLMAVLSAFSSAGIYRLKNSWAQVDPAKERLFAGHKTLMDSSCNFNRYREVLWAMSEPCIPFLGLSLMDLQYSYDGNEDFLQGDVRLVNFAKWSVIASIIDVATRFRTIEYRLDVQEHAKAYIRAAVPAAPHLEAQYSTSLAAEPRVQPRLKTRRSV